MNSTLATEPTEKVTSKPGLETWGKNERMRQASASEQRRQNLMRKELAWLRRGAPARTSKPKFRIDAANELIADEPG